MLADRCATAAFDELRAAKKTKEFYPLPTFRGYLRDASGHLTSRELRTLRTELSEYERTSKNATAGQMTSMNPSAGLFTD